MASTINCSIIIATYNRAILLAQTLESLAGHLSEYQTRAEVEVIVVDNNSPDETTKVANSFSDRFENYQVLFEPQQGLSPARNAGLAVATGEFIVFLDDDVELETGWLKGLLCEFTEPNIAVVGGKVLAFGNRVLPDWLPREYAYLVSVFDPSEVVTDLRSVMGGNSAVRRSIFEKVGVFNPLLGRRGNKLLGGEETELYRKISAIGGRIVYTPHATIFHKIDEKIKKEYVIDYAYWLGVSEAKIDKEVISNTKFILKTIRSIFFPKVIYPFIKYKWDCRSRAVKLAIKIEYSKGYLDRSSNESGK